MTSLKYKMMALMVLSFSLSNAQTKNAKTETVKIYGNCGMCESTIEKAGNLKKVASVDWDQETSLATITYDSIKTNKDEILKRVALAGYDSDLFLAPDDTYANLPGCCQYERVKKSTTSIEKPAMEMKNHANHNSTEKKQEENQLKAVFTSYDVLKNALVKSDGNLASLKANELLKAINNVKMESLSMEEHTVWMKIKKDLLFDANHIKSKKDAGHQRDHFTSLSSNVYQLLLVSKQETPTYYQFCPMANGGKGANWLSKQETIKNPYFGAKMLSCGKTVETIK
ncbi:MAG: copper chaperone CopZ [Flavobacteriales bacterium]|jgi:copper chaperone CopZ